jgi:septum formation protein
MKVILASASPRRQELLQQVGWDFEVRVAAFAEAKTTAAVASLLQGLEPDWLTACLQGKSPESAQALVAYNAYGKARAVQEQLAAVARTAGIPAAVVAEGTSVPIVAADTVVVRQGTIMGKPADEQEAVSMLTALSDGWHQVLTGVAVCYRQRCLVKVVATDVHFRKLDAAEIKAYVATKAPLDKAGAYGIQGQAAIFCDRIEGSYDNVVGLPLAALHDLVQQITVA